jgi:hypothetical protein
MQVAPTIQEEDETGGHENENEDGLQEVMTLFHYVPYILSYVP